MKKQILTILILSLSVIIQAQSLQSNLIVNNEGAFAYTDDNGITIETRVFIENEKDKAKIVFWQETHNGFFFNKTSWVGNVYLHLDNEEQIVLLDRDMNGHDKQEGAYIAGYFIPDLYQRYSSYYLTNTECEKLKNNKLVKVTYHLDDEFDSTEQSINFGNDQLSLRSQIITIGR